MGALVGGIALACSDEPTAVHVIPPSEVIREFANGCHVDATETTFGSDSSQVLVTFEGGWERCYPALAAYGIDMADPLGVDTPQGDMRWQIAEADHVANAPSGTDAATTYLTGDRIMIEFDPPVRSVEFHYSRLTPDGAYWGGVWSSTDSMPVYAMSRTPGTTTYQTYDREVLYSNVPSALPPWSVWDYARLDAPGDYIEWLWFDGDAAIDDLKITRLTVPDTGFSVTVQCSPSPVVRGQTVTCEASWTPTSIQASEIAFAWEFQGDSIKVFPDPTAGGFEPPAPVDSSGTGMDSWSGPAVLGGTVALTGTWDGRVDTDSTELVVNARSGPEWGDLPTNLDTVPFRDIPTDSTVPLQQQPSPIAGDPTLGLMGLNLDSIAGLPGPIR